MVPWFPVHALCLALGPSRYDVHKIFGFFDPLPPYLHLELFYTKKFTEPPLLRPLFHEPLPLMRTSYLDAPYVMIYNECHRAMKTEP